MKENVYLPHLAKITEIIDEAGGPRAIKTFRAEFENPELKEKFDFIPGQFAIVSLFGLGEATFCLSQSPTRKGFVEFSIMRTGKLTNTIHEMDIGDVIGVRGPLGNGFPMDYLKGKDVIFVGGGIGLAPLRSVINYLMDRRSDYGTVYILYGARTPADLIYQYEIEEWKKIANTEVFLTVDIADDKWKGNVGVVPALFQPTGQEKKPYELLKTLDTTKKNPILITCGPPIMIKFVIKALKELEFADDQILTTLEKRMKCGIGKCARCGFGEKYVCLDGPVFSQKELLGSYGDL